jgi:hypothetical protein
MIIISAVVSEQYSAFKVAKNVMWLSKVSSLDWPARANKTLLLVLPAAAFIIALLAVIIFIPTS